MHDIRCLRCGSHRLIPDVRLYDRDRSGGTREDMATFLRNPTALLFKGRVESPIRAWVCGECGHLEAFVTEPRIMWRAYIESAGLTAETVCDKCGYDLRGHLESSFCPECGDRFRTTDA